MTKCDHCEKDAEYHYYNRLSGYRGNFCKDCLANLRSEVSVEHWVEVGFATKILKEGEV